MNCYLYNAKIWQLNNNTDLLAEYLKKYSKGLQNLNINLTNRCLEIQTGIQEKGGRHHFENKIDSIKLQIEKDYGRVIRYEIKEIMIII